MQGRGLRNLISKNPSLCIRIATIFTQSTIALNFPLFYLWQSLFHVGPEDLGLLVTCAVSGDIAIVLIYSKLTKHNALSTLFSCGMGSIGVGSILIGTATSYHQLMLGFLFEGFGSALIMPTANALMVDFSPPERKGSALSALMQCIQIGSLVGLLVAVLFADQLVGQVQGWRIFLLSMPGLLALG